MTVLRAALAAWALALLVFAAPAQAIEIPPFTPNVVDPGGVLDEDARATVDAELQRIRAEAGILGAVYIVDTLGGEPIESVAYEAFRQWELGRKGLDDGLLLVLAMRDRQSRFEVGYGLEGRLPDLVAKRALDVYLAPGLRAGDTAGAIVAAFGFLARVAANDPEAAREVAESNGDASTEGGDGDPFFWQRGLVAWGVMTAAVWLTLPLRDAWVRRRRARLEKAEPALLRDDGEIAGNGRRASGRQRASGWGRIGIAAFLTVNPGLFVFIGAAVAEEALVASIAATVLVMALVIGFGIHRYASPAHYRRFLERRDRQRAALIAKGHLREASPGVYAYTPAYHASVASSSSSSSSSSSGFGSSSSSSSSSGGGRSGGGGASGSW